MKLRPWLKKIHQLSYADYKNLSDGSQWELWAEFVEYNRSCEQKKRSMMQQVGEK